MSFTISNATIFYPHVYEHREFDGRARYGIAFSVAQEAARQGLIDGGVREKEIEGLLLFNATTTFAPLITLKHENHYEKLVFATQLAAARNTTIDVALRELTADLVLEIFDYDYQGKNGKGLSLREIILHDAVALLNNVYTFKRS